MFPFIRPPKSKLQEWMRLANPVHRERLAEMSGTSEGYLYGLAGLHRKGIGAKLAVRIQRATETLNEETDGYLPIVTVEDLAFAAEEDEE